MIFPGGVTLAELGGDHFMVNDHRNISTVALAITVIQWVESREHQISAKPGK
jgi:hypothetical protein